jgi:hypothetical protein
MNPTIYAPARAFQKMKPGRIGSDHITSKRELSKQAR